MPQYLAPGVYIEEVPGSKPIEGVGTATGAFVGIAEKGPIGEPILVTNFTQFVETFGGFVAHAYLAYAVQHFFNEGGTRCYVVRTCHYTTLTDRSTFSARAASLTLRDRATTARNTLRIDALSAGSWGDHVGILVADAPGSLFSLSVLDHGQVRETYDKLTPASAPGAINGASRYIRVTDLTSTTAAPNNRPAVSEVLLGGLGATALDRDLAVDVAAGTGGIFSLTVRQAGVVVEGPYGNLTMSTVERKINGVSSFLTVRVADAANPPAATTTPTALRFFALAGGWDGLSGVRLQDRGTPPVDTLAVSAWRDGVSLDVANATADAANAFKITVKVAGEEVETFDNLTLATVEREVNERSVFIQVNDLGSATAAPGNRPAVTTASVAVPAGLTDGDFLGAESARNALHAFDTVDDINIVAIPDRPGDREVILAAAAYCQNRGDCFLVADVPFGLSPQAALQFKQGTGDYAGNAFNSSYAALYYPWILASDPLTGGTKAVPPSGAIVGTYSATDVARGVHKAPAGINEGYLNSAVGIERAVTKGEQELLNPEGINVIRSFPGAGIVVWGARTLSADAQWKYINVRRLLLFIEESIEQGTQWVVFEPNDRSLWAKVKRDVSSFLSVVWQGGALFGATPQEAFFVKVDDENNPPEVRDLGRLIIDVGVAPVKPAEFVVFRIAQKTQGAKA
jgi:phage tail sheath protein FI